MNSRDRLLAALRRESLDRIPVITQGFAEPFLRRYFDPDLGEHPLREGANFNPDLDPLDAQIAAHQRFGFDPFIVLRYRSGPGELCDYFDYWVLHKWKCDAWAVSEIEREIRHDHTIVEHFIETPKGRLRTVIAYQLGHTRWIIEPPIKEEEDILLLQFRSEPSKLPIVSAVNSQLQKIGGIGIGYECVPGVWQAAAGLRGSTPLMYDVYDRPQWVLRFFGILTDYLVEFVKVLNASDLEVMTLLESEVGMGISPSIFKEFVLPYDSAIVEAASEGGLLTIYHNCGRSSALLELMASTGVCAVELLAPPSAMGGDVDLADAKRRIGHTVCLKGGLVTNVVEKGSRDAIAAEVERCLEAAATGGGYILSPVNPIYDAPFDNLEFLAHEVKRKSVAYVTSTPPRPTSDRSEE